MIQLFFQLDRHMRRLDQDLNRFTIELEADTAGITEILEQSETVYLLFSIVLRQRRGLNFYHHKTPGNL